MELIARTGAVSITAGEVAAKRIAELVSAVGLSFKGRMYASANDNTEIIATILVNGRVSFFEAIIAGMSARWAEEAQAGKGEEIDDAETVRDATKCIVIRDATKHVIKNAILECIGAEQAVETRIAPPIEEIETASDISGEVAATKSIVEKRIAKFIIDISRYVEDIRVLEEANDVNAAKTIVAFKAVEAAKSFGEAAFIGAAYDKAWEKFVELRLEAESEPCSEVAQNTFHYFCDMKETVRNRFFWPDAGDIRPQDCAPSQSDIARGG